MELTIYRINQYQAYMASEQGVYFDLYRPSDTEYYKSESEKIIIELPEGFRLEDICDGNDQQLMYGEHEVIIGENQKGIYLEVCCMEPFKVYPKILSRE